jgi:hypothetical protein
MSELDLTEQHARQRAGFAAPVRFQFLETTTATMRITARCTCGGV